MKKMSLKNLQLNKKPISSFNNLSGGLNRPTQNGRECTFVEYSDLCSPSRYAPSNCYCNVDTNQQTQGVGCNTIP